MQANLSTAGEAALVGKLHPIMSATDTRSLGGSGAVPSFPCQSVHWPGSSSGNCRPRGFTEDAAGPCARPAPSPRRAHRCPWCEIQSARHDPEGSASVLLPGPPLPSSLSPSLSLTLLLTVPGTHQLRSGHRAFARAVLAPRIPLPPASHCECPLPGVVSSSERSSLVSSRRTAPRPGPVRTRRHPPPCLIPAPHSSQHPWTYHGFYLFAYYLLPLREGQGEAFCLFGSQTVSRVPST